MDPNGVAVPSVTPDADVVEELLKDELGRADAAMGRTETKTSILLGVFSPVLTVGLALLPRASLPAPATGAFWAALALLTAALLLLLWNVRPRLHGSGFATYAAMTEPELAQHIADAAGDRLQWHCQRLLVVARLGRKKFMLLSTATSLIFAALLCSAFAAIAAAV